MTTRMVVAGSLSDLMKGGKLMMPLRMAGKGCTCVIGKIGGLGETRRYLENLGFCAGEPVTVISEMNGSVIVSIRNSRVALGKEMTENIMIREISN
mgnify:CR=1 FL=1